MFSGVSLADRLKAAVNQIEQTGSQLQARAISASESVRTASNVPSPTAKPSRPSTPGAPATSTAPGASAAGTSPKNGTASTTSLDDATAAAKAYAASSAQLAESALSGLRKSFHMARSSIDGSRPASVDLLSPSGEARKEDKELQLKDTKPAISEEKEEGKTAPSANGAQDTDEGTAPSPVVDDPSDKAVVAKGTDSGADVKATVVEPKETGEINAPTSPPDAVDATDEPPTPSEPVDTPTTTGDAGPKSNKKKKKKNKKKGKAAADKEREDDKDEDDKEEQTKGEDEKVGPNEEQPKESKEEPKVDEPSQVEPMESPEQDVTASQAASDPEPEKKDLPEPTSKPSPEAKEALQTAIKESKKPDNLPHSPPAVVSPSKEDDPSKRLVDVERRFEQLSTRYTDLLTQTHSANKVLKDLTPLEGGIADVDAFEGWIRMMNGKVEMITSELTRLQNKVTLQESRMEEVRDTYHLESKSQSEMIDKLRAQLSTAESDLSVKAADLVQMGQLRADLSKSRADLSKSQTQTKEEEEKRTKAISLLKTVRQKLAKVEKEKEEIEKDRAEERAQRSRALEDVEKVKAERERETNTLRKTFEREIANLKERNAKDLATKKAAWELEMITTKAGHAKELTAKAAKITSLETTVKDLHASNSTQFDTIQSRQAEAEGARSEMEAMQTRTKELEFQLREATERLQLLEDVPRGSPQDASPIVRESGTSAAEVARLLAEAESRADQRVQDMRTRVRTLERERNELEEDWAAKLAQRVKELDALRRTISDKEAEAAAAAAARRDRDARIDLQDSEKRDLERQLVTLRAAVEEAHAEVSVAAEAERAARDELAASQSATASVQTQLDEAKAQHVQLRQTNKTLRDELRKVQSATQLLERQRNPGVGYWAAGQQGTPVPAGSTLPASGTAAATTPSGVVSPPSVASPAPASSTTSDNNDEEVNLEYLRNVILQFLENKEMRPNLVRVLSVILRFTPQELRRLNAKLGT